MLRQITLFTIISAVVLALSVAGCGGGTPVVPSGGSGADTAACLSSPGDGAAGRVLWGVYDITINAETLEAEVVPLRGPMFTANVTQFMQPPFSKIYMISLKVDPSSTPATGYFVVDVTLRHPFPGLDFYNGFDVRGILMSDGSGNLSHDSTAVYAGDGDTMLVNADGYTRWWNWQEFAPQNTIFGPTRGKLAPPNKPSGTVNGYKYFADGLDLNDAVKSVDPATRGQFTSTAANTRRYAIQFRMSGGKIVFDFNYAVDASWAKPDESYAPDYPPEAFPWDANCAEAFLMTLEDAGSTAWYVDDINKGGTLALDVEVYDWQAMSGASKVPDELAGLWLEGEVLASPLDLLASATILDGGPASSVFHVEISDLSLTKSGPNEVWIIAESAGPNTYEPNLDIDTSPWTWPDSPLAGYLRTTVVISDTQLQSAPEVTAIDPEEGHADSIVSATVSGDYFENGCQVELRQSSGTFVVEGSGENWVSENEVTGDLDLAGAPLGLYDVVVINPDLQEGSLEEGFEVLEANIIYVDDSNTSGTEDGTMAHPFRTIPGGMTAATSGWEVWVDDSGSTYAGPVTLKSGVVLKSVNWDDTDGGDEATILISSTASCVTGADNATIDGFRIDAVRCGIVCTGTSPKILNCRVVNCYYSDARPIWLQGGSHAHIDGCEVYDVNNATDYGYSTFYGILVEYCDAVGSDTVVIEHTVVHHVFSSDIIGLGGGYCYPHGILINSSDGVVVKNTIVHDVTGGNYHEVYGIRVADSAEVELVNNVIYDVDKTYYYGIAYGLYFTNCTNLDARNLIISHVHKGEGGTGGYYQTAYGVYQSSSTYSFEYCDVYDCQTANYNNVSPGMGCISANPQYVNPGTDFHLASGSPCINTGDPSIDDPDGSQSDMGAYGGPGGDW